MSERFPSLSSTIALKEHVTPWLTFKDRNEKRMFEKFKSDQGNTYAIVIIQILVGTYIILNKYFSFVYYPSYLTVVSLIAGMLFPVLWGILLILLRILPFTTGRFTGISVYFESFWILGSCLTFTLSIIVAVHNGGCIHDDFARSEGCNLDANTMPMDLLFAAAFIPSMFSVVFKGAKWEFVVLSFVLSIAGLLYCIFMYNLTNSLSSLIIFTPMCMVVMFENQRQNIALFLLTQTQQNLIEENERLAEEVHANELRHMIGNVAHDLKTASLMFI